MRYENSFCCNPVGAAVLIVVAVVVVTLSKTCNKLIKSFGQVGIVSFFSHFGTNEWYRNDRLNSSSSVVLVELK